jgi:hypothetical protein
MAHHVEFIRKRGLIWRLDVLPFIILYSIVFTLIDTSEEGLWRDLVLIGLIFSNCICYLLGHWSAYLKRHFQYFKC